MSPAHVDGRVMRKYSIPLDEDLDASSRFVYRSDSGTVDWLMDGNASTALSEMYGRLKEPHVLSSIKVTQGIA